VILYSGPHGMGNSASYEAHEEAVAQRLRLLNEFSFIEGMCQEASRPVKITYLMKS
jgi:hypothetical protein